MRLVDSGVDSSWGIQDFLRSAARDYAQHELDRTPTPRWKLAAGVAVVAAVASTTAVVSLRQGSGAAILLVPAVYVVLAGYQAYRTYKRPDRMRAVLGRLSPDQAEL